MIRDTRRDTEYFRAYIDYQQSRIDKIMQKLQHIRGIPEKKARRTLLMYRLDLTIAEFSYGASRQELIELLDDVYDTLADIEKTGYEQMLTVLSLSVMTGFKDDKIPAFVHKQYEFINTDRLLRCLSEYLCSGRTEWEGKFQYDMFSALRSLDKADDKSKVLSEYLNTWYRDHRDFAWYESDKKDKDTYVGYWSFETAALAVIFGVSDENLRNNVYYPVI